MSLCNIHTVINVIVLLIDGRGNDTVQSIAHRTGLSVNYPRKVSFKVEGSSSVLRMIVRP